MNVQDKGNATGVLARSAKLRTWPRARPPPSPDPIEPGILGCTATIHPKQERNVQRRNKQNTHMSQAILAASMGEPPPSAMMMSGSKRCNWQGGEDIHQWNFSGEAPAGAARWTCDMLADQHCRPALLLTPSRVDISAARMQTQYCNAFCPYCCLDPSHIDLRQRLLDAGQGRVRRHVCRRTGVRREQRKRVHIQSETNTKGGSRCWLAQEHAQL